MITLKCKAADGQPLQAVFSPESGMNLMSYKKGDIEVIDPSTRPLFDERYAGLGALIGPHFHRRRTVALPAIKDESLFPHIARTREKGIQDPFSHGIGRYAPWPAQSTETTVAARLTGKDLWNGVPLSTLEGQQFAMEYKAALTPQGLQIDFSVVSDTDSLVGIHYYYHLPRGHGTVSSQVQSRYREGTSLQPIPKEWLSDNQQTLQFDLKNGADYTFFPFPKPREGSIFLDAGDYRLLTTYTCPSQENCWQLYHPAGASYVCIEPISSQDPRNPNLTASSLRINLEIQDASRGK